MPPKRGKKGKRRGGYSSSDDEGTAAAAAAVAASIKSTTAAANDSVDFDGEEQQRRGNQKGGSKGGPDKEALASSSTAAAAPKNSKKNKKKGKRGKNNDDSDSDDGDVLDPLAHLRTGGAGGRGGRGADDDEEEDRPKKPLTKKEKRRLEEERLRREKEEKQPAAAGEDSSEEEDEEIPPTGAGGGVEEATVQAVKPSEKDKRSKKGETGKGADRGDEEGQEEDGGAQKKPLTKKERRRLESQEQRQRELEAEQAAVAAEAAAETAARNAEEDDTVADEDAPAASLKKSKKGKKKGKKGRRGDDDDDDNDRDSEEALSRGMESLSVVDAPPSSAPAKKLSKKERRRAEMRAAAGGGGGDEGGDEDEEEEEGAGAGAAAAAAAVAKEEAEARGREKTERAERKAVEAAAKAAAKAAADGKDKGKDEVEMMDEEDDGSQKRRMSKKERKKAKQQGGKKKGGDADMEPEPIVEEAPETQPPQPDADEGRADSASPPPAPPSPPSTAVEQPTNMDVVGDGVIARGAPDVASPVPAGDPVDPPAPPAAAAAAAAVEETADTKKPKKEKKSKLRRKMEEAARLRAEAEANAGVVAEGNSAVDDEKRALEEAEAERKRKQEKKAKKAKKEATKEKDSKVKSILEDLDDAEYYGSDHEERGKKGANGGGGGKKETVEEELTRLVTAAEAGGKAATARQRKKILQDIEGRRRAAAEEEREELAHRDGAQFGCSQTAVSAGDQQWANSLDVTIEAFSISAHDKTLFKDSSLQVVHGRKYGLVGPNGAGKSTLLKMIASGELRIPPRIDCLYVEQEVVADDTPAVIAVMKADKARWSLMEEERRVNRLLRDDPENEKLNDRLQQVHEELHTSGGDGAEASARRILFGLGFDDVMQVKATKHFSGGWRMRISLARALFMEPTLLMLDEPTNHLDLNAVIWLDDYLQKWKKTLLVVSHDQDFLNSVCEEILHLDHQRVNQYKGNYDQFKEMEAQKRRQQAKEWEKQQRKLTSLKKGGQSRGKAEETVKKSKFREPGGSKKKKNDAVASGTGEVEKTQLVERPREYVVTLNFPQVSTLSPPVVEVMDVDFKYATGPTILKDVNFGLDQSSRVCIVGPNGAGKTTLLKLLTGALEPSLGFIRRNPRMRAGIYNQHFVDRLPMDIDPTSYLRSKFSDQCDYQSARNLLGRFGLEGHAHTIKMRDLSGGQKARVVFCELSLQAPHVLFLDEPTNNLDIESIDALCDAVTRYNGGVVVVTHDARLIEATECRLWIVDEQEVTPWQGEFEEYRADLLQKLEEKLAAQEQARADKTAA